LKQGRPIERADAGPKQEDAMGVKHLETDVTDEAIINWYDIDGVTYGATSDGKILDRDGVQIVNDGNARWAIERFEADQA
jgi:hypothetical protein